MKESIENQSAVIYARVSSETDRQNTDRQVIDCQEFASRRGFKVEKVFTEHISGAKKKSERKALCECFDYCKANGISTLLISELSRLGRSMTDVFNTVTEAGENDLTILQVKDGTQIENKSIGGKALLFALSLAAEIERENIRFRLESGKQVYIANGGKMGRHIGYRKPQEDKEREYKEVIGMLKKAKEMDEKGIRVPEYTIRGIASQCAVSVSTVQRLKKEFLDNEEDQNY